MPSKKLGNIGKMEEMRNTLNFIFIVFGTIVLLSFLLSSKLTGMAVSEAKTPKYLFCAKPVFESSQTGGAKVSCSDWIDVSPILEKLDGSYIILKRDEALVFSFDLNRSEKIRIIGNVIRDNSCLNVKPDYIGDMTYLMITGECSHANSTLIDYPFKFVKVNDEISATFGYPVGAAMKTMLLDTFEIVELDGIFYNKVVLKDNEKDKTVSLNANIPSLPGKYGPKYLDAWIDTPNSEICTEGCLVENVACIAFGNDWGEHYCDADKSLKDKKDRGSVCRNNYECKSSICAENKCKIKFLGFLL